jgi:hypothetical protein
MKAIYGSKTSKIKKAISLIKSFLRWVRRSRLAVDEWVLEYQEARHFPEERIAWSDEQVKALLQPLTSIVSLECQRVMALWPWIDADRWNF